MAQDLDELYKLIGKDKYDEIVDYAKDLRKQGKSPNDIADMVMAKYPGAIRPMIIFALSPLIFVLAAKPPP